MCLDTITVTFDLWLTVMTLHERNNYKAANLILYNKLALVNNCDWTNNGVKDGRVETASLYGGNRHTYTFAVRISINYLTLHGYYTTATINTTSWKQVDFSQLQKSVLQQNSK